MIRISSPLLPYRLIARGNTLRCAIYYWYTAFPTREGTAEIPKGPSFDKLYIAYTNNIAPLKTPSRYLYKYGLVTNRLPAIVLLGNMNPICDTLVI
jgi:hypothetical protein